MTSTLLTDTPFSAFDLPRSLARGLEEAGFSHCTAIQAAALPLALDGMDVAGQAQTGTGKTVAYLVALYAHLATHPPASNRRPNQPRAVILAPTRELAIQIHRDAEQVGRYADLEHGLAYGGTDYVKQRDRLRQGVDILVGTPGRIIDFFKQGVFDLKAVQGMVLDEADRMFDLGFIKDIRYLLRRLPRPEQRLSMLFSATLSYRVMELAYEHMNNPQLVKVGTDRVTTEKIRELVFFPSNEEKIPLLLGVLKRMAPTRTMLFVNTKHSAERLARYLDANGYRTALLSGDVPQRKRQRLLKGFLTGEFPMLVATDVASRGLHVPDVSHVINFDLPQSEDDYVHRIGRTARAGAEGDAISFACEEFAFHLPEIEAYIGHKIPVASVDHDLLIEPVRPAKRERRHKPSSRNQGKKSAGARRSSKRHKRPRKQETPSPTDPGGKNS